MDWTNYNHLQYFWVVARHGSVSKASVELQVSQPTISEQLGKLEKSTGVSLFERAGRGIRLTEAGQVMFGYADDIFRLGREMKDVLSGRPQIAKARLAVGITASIPKLLVGKLLAPAIRAAEELRVSCEEGALEEMLPRMAQRRLDFILSDAAAPAGSKVKVHSHLLASSGLSFMAGRKLKTGRKFPRNLDGAPFLMPQPNMTTHNLLEAWFQKQKIRPQIVGEISDSTLIQMFAQHGLGVIAVPTIIEREVKAIHQLAVIGRTTAIAEKFYAITMERRITNPSLIAIAKAAAGK